MWSSIANLKENLNKIALDVHDEDDEELGIYGSVATANGRDAGASISDRRNSHSFAHSMSVSHFPAANGIDAKCNSEIEQYKAEIRRLQESEKEIKALSVNYAALLKEKEDHISRLNKENGSLKHNLESTNSNLISSTNGVSDHSQNRSRKINGTLVQNGIVSKQDSMANGVAPASQSNAIQDRVELKQSAFSGKERELADLLEEKSRLPAAEQVAPEMKQLRMELERERDKSANIKLKLQEERKLNETFQEELKTLRMSNEKTSIEVRDIQKELNDKIIEIKRLQMESNGREDENVRDSADRLKRVIATLEKENTSLKMEKDKLEATLEMNRNSLTDKIPSGASQDINNHLSMNEKLDLSGNYHGKEEMELSLQKLDKDLRETRVERDKAVQELTRLKQHLLEKEFEESEKMDEDSKIIEELRQNNEYQRTQILHLEKSLKQAIANQEEIKMTNYSEIQKTKELIDDLNKNLMQCKSVIDAKNIELLNLQTALGQYYAEIEAKEHLEGSLARAREEIAKLSQLLKDVDQREEVLKREKEEISANLSLAERTLGEWKSRVNKLEEDNSKLRRALEQSMTRLNRMSIDSDFLVDRRIVIKLLVTYFQRNHSKEVLDLMVRMLGFSDEDKQRIGAAQQGPTKGVVRGVLGLPGRLVGGILGGGSAEVPTNGTPENHSFADLWVDFLLKENEERERREAEGGNKSQEDLHKSPNAGNTGTLISDNGRSSTIGATSSFSNTHLSPNRYSSSLPIGGRLNPSEHYDSEFSTVPLTSTEGNGNIWRLPPKF